MKKFTTILSIAVIFIPSIIYAQGGPPTFPPTLNDPGTPRVSINQGIGFLILLGLTYAVYKMRKTVKK